MRLGSKLGKEYIRAVYYHPAYLTYMQSSLESLSQVQFFATSWTLAHQASLSITSSRSLLTLMSIKSVMLFNHLILFHPLLLLPSILPSFRVFPVSQFFASGGQCIRVSALASVLPMNIQDWFPLGLTAWISMQSKGLSRVFSNTTVQKHQFFSAQLSLYSSSHILTHRRQWYPTPVLLPGWRSLVGCSPWGR